MSDDLKATRQILPLYLGFLFLLSGLLLAVMLRLIWQHFCKTLFHV